MFNWQAWNIFRKDVGIPYNFLYIIKEKSMKVKDVRRLNNKSSILFWFVDLYISRSVSRKKNYDFCIYFFKQNTCGLSKYMECYESKDFYCVMQHATPNLCKTTWINEKQKCLGESSHRHQKDKLTLKTMLKPVFMKKKDCNS